MSTTKLREPEEYFLIGQDDSRLVVYLRYQLFKALEDFAKRESKEQVGLLVGRVSETDSGTPFLLVEDAIEAPVGDESTGRFEENLWKRARRIAAARHPSREVVGWFHTHADGELALTDEERMVHKRYFPEDDHLLYVLSGAGQDRNFYFKVDGELVGVSGFRIYGKKPAGSAEMTAPELADARAGVNSVGAAPEQTTRQIERNLDKIQKKLQNPPMTKKDMAIMALLVINALLILFRPNPPVTVDTSTLEREHSDLSAQISSMRGRIERLERHLSDLSLLDEQLKLAAGVDDGSVDTDLGLDSGNTDTSTSPVATQDGEALSGGKGVIKLYKVSQGDILGVLVSKFYPDAPAGTLSAFADFNRLKAPDFAIFPGDTLKVPELEALRK